MALKLTPNVAKDLLMTLFHQRASWTNVEVARAAELKHLEQGGVVGAQPVKVVVKKALGQLGREGLISNIGKGLWALSTGAGEPNATPRDVGIPLQPVYARKLILQLLQQKEIWKRSDLAKRLAEDHIAAGHELGNQDPLVVTKKALYYLQEAGLVHSPGHGLWALAPTAEGQGDQDALSEQPAEETSSDGLSIKQRERSYVVLGDGAESVYLYYFENDKTAGISRGKITWDCKIGFATGDVEQRVFSQVKTSRSRRPILAVVIRTDSAAYLEKVIHNTLKILDRHIVDEERLTGVEWFDTNPDQLIAWWNRYKAAQEHFLK